VPTLTHRVTPAEVLKTAGPRGRRPRPGGLTLPILSLFALLVFTWAAVPARADSSGIQYQDAPPTACGEATCKGENLSAPSGSKPSRPESASKAAGDDSAAAENDLEAGGEPGAGRQGERKNRADQKPANHGPAEAQEKGAASTDASQAGDDGASPLVPILVAIAILAAASAGVIFYRRRQGPSDDTTGPSDDTPSATPPK
jgi:hypothetical protein